jgi:MFS family permease
LSDHEPSAEVASAGIDARRRVALAVVLSGMFVTIMDSSIVNVAIPTIRSTLHASFGEAELTVASYALAFSAGMITGGRLGDIYGHAFTRLLHTSSFPLPYDCQQMTICWRILLSHAVEHRHRKPPFR